MSKLDAERSHRRAAQPLKKLFGSQRILCYKCSKIRGRCKWFKAGLGKDIAKRLNKKLFQTLPQQVPGAVIQTWRDIQYITLFQQQMDPKDMLAMPCHGH